MNSFLLNRQLGSVGPGAFAKAQNERLICSLQQDQTVIFESSRRAKGVAHAAGVSSIAIDRFEGRWLLSAGADSSVAIWDLEAARPDGFSTQHTPLAAVSNTSVEASLGITHVTFYPFDSLAFITSGYDQTVKLFSSESLKASAKFELGATVYSHATSTVASHLLVACATQHPAVRLVDLQSGANAHTLVGHSGSVLTVAWHPKDSNLLASAASDGTVRLWDIRRSASSLGVLDMDDSIGIAGYDGKGSGARRRERGRAHIGAVNGITWSDDGQYLVSTGLDERMRVWDMSTGANTLANFGPALKNARNISVLPLLVPPDLCTAGRAFLLFPNPAEILSFDMYSGDMIQRLRTAAAKKEESVPTMGTRNMKSLTTALAWRAHHVELYSAHTDGLIRCWKPHTWEDDVAEDEMRPAAEQEDLESRKRKREDLEQIVRDLTGKRVTYN